MPSGYCYLRVELRHEQIFFILRKRARDVIFKLINKNSEQKTQMLPQCLAQFQPRAVFCICLVYNLNAPSKLSWQMYHFSHFFKK